MSEISIVSGKDHIIGPDGKNRKIKKNDGLMKPINETTEIDVSENEIETDGEVDIMSADKINESNNKKVQIL